ncbi:MAG: hypothetical protein WD359_06300 [Dehalococcoidia bacterium]
MNGSQRIDLTGWGTQAELLEPMTGGARNLSWMLKIQGKTGVARLSRRSPLALDWELDLMAAAAAAGVRTPGVVRTMNGRRHAGSIVIFEWVDGVTPESKRDWELVRDSLTQLHQSTRDWAQRPGFASTRDLLLHPRGGDVDFTRMPAGVVEACRQTWRAAMNEPMSAIHGDPSSNVLMVHGRPTFIDWDESRVDASMLDLDLPELDLLLPAQRRALVAWEVACSWSTEPEYARRRLKQLEALL